MDIKILRLKYKNIRDFKELKIDIAEDGNTPHICLIQMPTGTGKTTTMQLLRSVIGGKKIASEYVKSFKPKLFNAEEGFFEVLLKFDNEVYTIGIELDYSLGISSIYTSRPKIIAGGKEKDHNVPSEIKTFMNYDFAKFFIFDGELSGKMLDRSEIIAEIAISLVYGTDKLKWIIHDIERERERRIRANPTRVTNATTRAGLSQLKTKWERANKKLKTLKEQETTFTNSIKKLKKSYQDNDKKVQNAKHIDKDYKVKKENLERKIADAEATLKAHISKLFSIIRNPSLFSNEMRARLEKLSQNLKILGLPKTTSTEFFDALSKTAKHCICGTLLDEEKRKNILENAEKYLSEDDIAVMNAIKSHVSNMPATESIDTLIRDMGALKTGYNTLKQELKILISKVSKEEEDEINKLLEENRGIERKLAIEERQLKMLAATDTREQTDLGCNIENNINMCTRHMKDLEKKLAEAQGNLDFTLQADLLRNIIDRIYRKAIDSLKEEILSKTNKCISDFLGYKDIQIGSINKALILSDREGVSEGQKLAVAYAFLATLFHECQHHFPFVVDSPAGSLDIKVRREVSKRIPTLFEQLVVFITSGERTGFMPGIESYPDIRYFTIHRDLQKPGAVILNSDKAYFHSFHSDEE